MTVTHMTTAIAMAITSTMAAIINQNPCKVLRYMSRLSKKMRRAMMIRFIILKRQRIKNLKRAKGDLADH